MDSTSPSSEPLQPQGGRLARIHEALHRYRFVLAPISFATGVASFLLVQRQERVAQWLALLLLATWLLSVAEAALPQRLRVPQGLLRFVTQQAHQEAFFFSLPFLLRTTSWHSGQAIFTGGVALAALCSMWDPLYFGQIAARRWLYFAFHALAVYVVMLVALPLLLQLTTTQTLALAAIAVGLLAAPSLARNETEQRGAPQWLLMFAGAAALAGLTWLARPWVPSATLWVGDAIISAEFDVTQKTPGLARDLIDLDTLQKDGVYAYTAIRAPRGLRETVYHRWLHNGHEEAKVPLEILGGREEGYRAWSHKSGFPPDPAGKWQVQVVTESGQLIGLVRFRVAASAEQPADQSPLSEHGEAAGDQQPDKSTDHEVPVTPDVAPSNEPQPGAEREQSPQGQQVNPAVVPRTQNLDEQRRSADEVHRSEPGPAEPAVRGGALGPPKLDQSDQQRDDRGGKVPADDRRNVAPEHDAPPSPAPSAPESSPP